MGSTEISVTVGVLTFLFSVGMILWNNGKASTLAQANYAKALTDVKDTLITEMAKQRTAMDEQRDLDNRNIGVAISSLTNRAATVELEIYKKIGEVEIFMRDTFVRRQSMHDMVSQLSGQMHTMRTDILAAIQATRGNRNNQTH